MQKLFRIKKEAVQFFDSKFATWVQPIQTWEKFQVHINALEEVEKVMVIYGLKHPDSNYTDLGHWSGESQSSSFHFTIQVSQQNHNEYDEFSKTENIREIMNDIQDILNRKFNA